MNDTCAVCVCVQIGNSAKGVELEDRYLPKVRKGACLVVLELWVETSLGFCLGTNKIHTQNAKFCSNSKSWA